MTAKRIDGKAAAPAIRERVADARRRVRAARPAARPGLATVLVGEDPASAVYVRSKDKATAEAGMASFAHNLPDTTQRGRAARSSSIELNADDAVDGILVQLPLPPQIDATRVIATIEPDKDVDGFHPSTPAGWRPGSTALVPCTPLGCLHLLQAASSATSPASTRW